MSRPYRASNICDACGNEHAVAWLLEDEEGVMEMLVLRCMWCDHWEFVAYTDET